MFNSPIAAFFLDRLAHRYGGQGGGVSIGGGGEPPSGPAGDGLMLEDGASFLLAEDGNYLILE